MRGCFHYYYQYCPYMALLIGVMGSVTFTPHYTLRAVSSGQDSTLKIRYHAKIANNSGEDWNDVALAISTAQASETTGVPRLMRWTVDFRAPAGNYYSAQKARGVSKGVLNFSNNASRTRQTAALWRQEGFAADSLGGPGGVYMADEPDIVTSAAEVSEGITSTFVIPGRQTIKDGEKSHTVVIRDLVLEGKFANICVPKVKDVAYLQVRTWKAILIGRLA